jgi:hypothetical protein
MCLQENNHKRTGKLTFYNSFHITSMSGYHLRCHAGKLSTSGATHACHVTNPREASPNELEHDMWTSHGAMAPPEHLNRLKNTCTPGTDLRAHRTATPTKHTRVGPTWGRPILASAKPTLGRLILGLHVVLVHWS